MYVIDFIGNGKASRALIHKGKLQFFVRTSVAGQIFTILDEQNKPAPEAVLWLAGTLYTPDKEGEIVVPFSNQPGRQPIVMSLGGFSSLDYVEQEAENYHLSVAMYVDREELIARRKAQLIVRPQPLAQRHAHYSQVARRRAAGDRLNRLGRRGQHQRSSPISSCSPIGKRFMNSKCLSGWRSFSFMLKAKMQNQSHNQKVDLVAEQSFSINEIDRTDKTEDPHFARVDNDYMIDLLGKTGEAKPISQCRFSSNSATSRSPCLRRCNPTQGRVLLGPLPGVVTVTATSPHGVLAPGPFAAMNIPTPNQSKARPASRSKSPTWAKVPSPSALNFRCSNCGAISSSPIASRICRSKMGFWSWTNSPRGIIPCSQETGRQIRLRLTEGPQRDNYVMGSYRKLEVQNAKPLQIKAVEVTDDVVRVQLENAKPLARVHVFGTRFEPAFSAFGILSGSGWPEPYSFLTPRVESQYIAGRNIGDEYRYILDRKFAKKYPGNMLERPSLLLNPWAIRSTETGQQEAHAGEAFGGIPKEAATAGGRVVGAGDGAGCTSRFCRPRFPGVQLARRGERRAGQKRHRRIQTSRSWTPSGIAVRGRRSAKHGQPDRGAARSQGGFSRPAAWPRDSIRSCISRSKS